MNYYTLGVTFAALLVIFAYWLISDLWITKVMVHWDPIKFYDPYLERVRIVRRDIGRPDAAVTIHALGKTYYYPTGSTIRMVSDEHGLLWVDNDHVK